MFFSKILLSCHSLHPPPRAVRETLGGSRAGRGERCEAVSGECLQLLGGTWGQADPREPRAVFRRDLLVS